VQRAAFCRARISATARASNAPAVRSALRSTRTASPDESPSAPRIAWPNTSGSAFVSPCSSTRRNRWVSSAAFGSGSATPARVALDLYGQMEDRADQHDATAYARRATAGDRAGGAARSRRRAAVGIEHREQRGLLAARDRGEAGVERAAALPTVREPGRHRPGTSLRSLPLATRSSRLSARSSSNVSNTASRQPARTSARSSSACGTPAHRCPP